MIIEGLSDFAFWVLKQIFDSFIIPNGNIDTSLVLALWDFVQTGVWVLGGDLFGMVMGSLFGFLGMRLTLGLGLFIWRLLPLT